MADIDEPYFDPRTGEKITEQQWIERYSVTAFAYVARAPKPDLSKPDMPGLVGFSAVCKGCGTAVSKPGDLCDMCKDKPHLQSPMMVVGKQPRPAYEREPEPLTE